MTPDPPQPKDAVSKPAAGWYDDPEQPTRRRYWDGTQWTQQFAAGAGAAVAPDPRRPNFWQRPPGIAIIGVAGLLIGIGLGASGGGDTKTTTITQARNQVSTATVPGATKTVNKVRTVTHTITKTVTTDTGGGGGTGGGGNCDPNYTGACVPTGQGDVNCSDIPQKNFQSVGSDPDGLDRDGDGVACEG